MKPHEGIHLTTREAIRMIEAKEPPVVFENPVLTCPDQNMALSCSFQTVIEGLQKFCVPRQNNKYVAHSWQFLSQYVTISESSALLFMDEFLVSGTCL
jgi:hypothetical protein